MVTLTKEDLNVLRAPFKAKEHEFLRGFAYVAEFAVVNRIEDVDPAWQFEITSLVTRPTVGIKDQVQVTCTAALTINGTTRYGVGQAKAYETKAYPDKQSGEMKPTEEANEAEKSAATDALKRAARLFGIGRYLLVLPKDIKDERALETWLQRMLEAKAKAEGFKDDPAYAKMEQMAKDYLLTGDERILTGDNRTTMPNLQERDDWSGGEIADQMVGGYEDLPSDAAEASYRLDPDARAALIKSLDNIGDKHGYGMEPDPHDYDEGETSYDDPTPTEHYTIPTNIVVTKAGKEGKIDNLYHVIEGCTFFSREAFRLLSYEDDVIESLGEVGITDLQDTVTVVYTQEGDFKKPVRVRRNSINAVVDVTGVASLVSY